MALPVSLREYEELYTLTPADLEFVAAHRTNPNRLGVAVQLCFLRCLCSTLKDQVNEDLFAFCKA